MNPKLNLSQLKPGTPAVITRILRESEAIHRLEEVGLLEGRPLRLLKIAPPGDPLEIPVLNADFCLRKREVSLIMVRTIDEVEFARLAVEGADDA